MPNPTQRPSLATNLVTRYANQTEGGAYDAKKAGTSTTETSLLGALYLDSDVFLVRESTSTSNFKGANNLNYKEISLYAQNLDTRRYKS